MQFSLNSILVIFTPTFNRMANRCVATLNSILVIFTQRGFFFLSQIAYFKFHSGYIYTCNVHIKLLPFLSLNSILVIFTQKAKITNRHELYSFKFHSGYIYTSSKSSNRRFRKDFKFHSGYIYTKNL